MAEQVLVTGVSGFIAKHVTLALLKAGHAVRGTVRSLGKADAVRASLAAAGADTTGLSFAAADLESDAGWAEAAAGCAHVQHIASPFPISQPRAREALVPAAREGTLRVLRAARAAGARRVVLTSSMVAMMYRASRPAAFTVRENDWTDPEWSTATPYIISKTRAERAAWDDVEAAGDRARLAVVNPGFVLGPGLDADAGASLQVVQLLLSGAYPALPPISFPVVDVRDLAALHVAAMVTPEAGGRRLMAAADTMTMQDMARILRGDFPDRARKIPTGTLPAAMVRALALFDPTLKTVLADMGAVPTADAGYVTALTGVSFRPGRDAVVAAAQSLIEHKVV